MGFEDILTRDEVSKITKRGTPFTEQELALIRAQGVIDGLREGEQARMKHAIETMQPDRGKNQ